jgi:hypothetical protein
VSEHECQRADWCECQMDADEPNEKCPVHGAGEWPWRCCECGRFMPYLREISDEDPGGVDPQVGWR